MLDLGRPKGIYISDTPLCQKTIKVYIQHVT